MKKIGILLLGVMLLTGCGKKDNVDADFVDPNAAKVTESQDKTEEDLGTNEGTTDEDGETVSDNVGEVIPEGFYFKSGNTYIQIGDEAAAVLNGLGEWMEYFEAESCAFQGLDKFYFYDGFELAVNDIDGVDVVTGISIVDDSVATPEGLRIGSSVSDMERLLGTEYESSLGLYNYQDGDALLSILTKDDEVLSIEYMMKVEME